MSVHTPTTRPIVVSGSHDATVRVWDLEAGGQLGGPLVGHDDWVNAVALGEAPRPLAL
jgi:WD40 repeat protein